jgi:hypothetical protein
MSRIVGDSLVGGPETAFAPEFVTVRLTRGQAEALAVSAEYAQEALADSDVPTQSDREFLASSIDAIRAQIGGAL